MPVRKTIEKDVTMVHTRSSQGPQGSRKRRASASPSETVGSQVAKTRKTVHGRKYATADEQIHQEERLSLERSVEPTEHQSSAFQVVNYPQLTTPTHSRPSSRHSLPANLPNVKFESLRVALARETQRRRRQSDIVTLDGADTALEDEETTTYIELNDLGIDAAQLATPRRSIVPARHAPQSIVRKPSPNVKREDDIAGYEDSITILTREKAELQAQLQILQLAVRSLRFEPSDIPEDDMCAQIRADFDDVRNQEAEMNIELPFEQMSNQELLHAQPDIIRGLLQEVKEYTLVLEETDSRLALTEAEYKGVLGKLAEREERNEVQEALLEKADVLALSHKDEITTLRASSDKLRANIQKLEDELEALKEEYDRDMDALEAEKDDAVALMAEELEQEHDYRQIAEREIADQDAAYTGLQIKFNNVTTDLNIVKEDLNSANMVIETKEQEIVNLIDKVAELEEEKKQTEDAFADIEDKVVELESDIKTLTTRLGTAENTVVDQNDALDQVNVELKTKETEINQLRTDVFGIKEEVKHKNGLITKLEHDIGALNKSMEDLKAEKDAVIEEKNQELDSLDDKIDDLTREGQKKDADIEALRKENLKIIATNESLRKALATRGKDVRVLKGITNQLLGDAEQDITAQREWAARKTVLLQDVRTAVATVDLEAAATTTLVQQTEKHTMRATATVRDSGYLGEDEEHTQEAQLEHERDGMLLENGY